jgi:hypothetical protein
LKFSNGYLAWLKNHVGMVLSFQKLNGPKINGIKSGKPEVDV